MHYTSDGEVVFQNGDFVVFTAKTVRNQFTTDRTYLVVSDINGWCSIDKDDSGNRNAAASGWFRPATEEEAKFYIVYGIGKFVTLNNQFSKNAKRIIGYHPDFKDSLKLEGMEDALVMYNNFRPASGQEILNYFINKANSLKLVTNAYANRAELNLDPTICKLENTKGVTEYNYDDVLDTFAINDFVVYRKGVWASLYEEIRFMGFAADFSRSGDVGFGIHTFTKEQLVKALRAMEDLNVNLVLECRGYYLGKNDLKKIISHIK